MGKSPCLNIFNGTFPIKNGIFPLNMVTQRWHPQGPCRPSLSASVFPEAVACDPISRRSSIDFSM